MSLEAALVAYCSPTLAGLKLASLYRFTPEDASAFAQDLLRWQTWFPKRGLELRILARRERSWLMYLYRPGLLEEALCAPDAAALLRGFGYDTDGGMAALLQQLSARFQALGTTPHEIGIFLGYPLADVVGFIENKGRNYTCSGCWKSYGDPEQARRRFSLYHACTDCYRRRFARGSSVRALTVAAWTRDNEILERMIQYMNSIAVVYWSGTGNTEEMAQAVADGAKTAGAAVEQFQPSDFSASQLAHYNVVAFGCPAMGDEELEDGEFAPMFSSLGPALEGKRLALFGSYGWGDGQWMRDWCERCRNAGAELFDGEGLIAMETPDDTALEACQKLGAALAAW